jgi:hypothetical protein
VSECVCVCVCGWVGGGPSLRLVEQSWTALRVQWTVRIYVVVDCEIRVVRSKRFTSHVCVTKGRVVPERIGEDINFIRECRLKQAADSLVGVFTTDVVLGVR